MIENISHGIGGWAEDRGRAKSQALLDRFAGVQSPDRVLAEWKAAHAVVLQKLDEQTKQAHVNAAFYEGSLAQINELKAALASVAPGHQALQMSSQKYTDGKQKSKLRLVFEGAFDAYLRKIGLNPLSHRKA